MSNAHTLQDKCRIENAKKAIRLGIDIDILFNMFSLSEYNQAIKELKAEAVQIDMSVKNEIS